MGFFGYNEKDYAKSTAALSSRIEKLNELVALNYPEAGVRLTKALIKMQGCPRPENTTKKQMAEIDARIGSLIDQMMTDAQQEKRGKLMGHADMLMSALVKSRAWGKEAYPPQQLKAQELIAECNSNIEESLVQKDRLTREMNIIVERGKKLRAEDPNSSELQRLQLQYASKNNELKNVDQNMQLWVKQYNNTVKQLQVMQDGEVYKEIEATHLQSPAEFAKQVESVSQQLAMVVGVQTAIVDIATEYDEMKNDSVSGTATTDDGGFWGAIENTGDVSQDIAGASAPAANNAASTNNTHSSNKLPF